MIDQTPIPRRYPRKVEVTRAVQAARDNGIPVSSIETTPDGVIRLYSTSLPRHPVAGGESEFDLWESEGKL